MFRNVYSISEDISLKADPEELSQETYAEERIFRFQAFQTWHRWHSHQFH